MEDGAVSRARNDLRTRARRRKRQDAWEARHPFRHYISHVDETNGTITFDTRRGAGLWPIVGGISPAWDVLLKACGYQPQEQEFRVNSELGLG